MGICFLSEHTHTQQGMVMWDVQGAVSAILFTLSQMGPRAPGN